MNRLKAGLLVCVLALCCAVVAQAPKHESALSKEFIAFRTKYYDALNVYYKPYENAKTAADMEKIKLDPTMHPAHKFFKQAKALAARAKKEKPVGLQAQVLVMQMAMELQDKSALQDGRKALLSDYINEDDFAMGINALTMIVYSETPGGDEQAIGEKILAVYDEVGRKSNNKSVKAMAEFMAAQHYARPGPMHDSEKAVRMFKSIQQEYAGTKYADRAEGQLFVAQNLNIGQVAPDFEGTDENGVKFKLSDYRGKVVVIDFWGFW